MTNNGYILGAPVMQSFALLLDFDKNRIGFGEKVNSMGAKLLTESSGHEDQHNPTIDDGDDHK